MDEMDKFTLECFVNKQTYQKYLAKHDPELFQETQGFYEKLLLHQRDIECITDHLLVNPESEQYNKTLRDSFESYMKTLLYHIEVERSATKHDRSGEIYDEDNGREPDEMFIEVSPSTDYVASDFPILSQKPENPIEYWKKYAVKKR